MGNRSDTTESLSMKMKILLLGFVGLILVGCATSTRYVNYTDQRFPFKDQYFSVNIYPKHKRFQRPTLIM